MARTSSTSSAAVVLILEGIVHTQLLQAALARGKHPQVAVQRAHILIGLQRGRHPHRNRLLPDAAKPLAHPPLPQQLQHTLLNHPRLQDEFIEKDQLLVGEFFPLEVHGGKVSSNLNNGGESC